jgi:Ca-activated chloride channel family protein
MNFPGDFHFIRPAWLLLAPLAVWIWWRVRKSQDPLRGWRAAIEPELLEALTVGRIANPSGDNADSSGRNGIPSYFPCRDVGLLVAWLLAVIAVAGPTWRPEPSPFADDPVPVMLVLRAGESMDVSDLAPSRMERARLKIADFAQQRKSLPLGLVAYSGSAHLVLPPTRDTSVVAAMAAEISPAVMPKVGDDLAGAIELAARTLGKDGGSIVVLADTVVDGAGKTLAEFRSESGLPVHFLAVARSDTPEWDAIRHAAATLRADVQLMTPDQEDVQSLVRRVAETPVAIGDAAAGTRWAEAGWWLVSVIAILSLGAFRRVGNR